MSETRMKDNNVPPVLFIFPYWCHRYYSFFHTSSQHQLLKLTENCFFAWPAKTDYSRGTKSVAM